MWILFLFKISLTFSVTGVSLSIIKHKSRFPFPVVNVASIHSISSFGLIEKAIVGFEIELHHPLPH